MSVEPRNCQILELILSWRRMQRYKQVSRESFLRVHWDNNWDEQVRIEWKNSASGRLAVVGGRGDG